MLMDCHPFLLPGSQFYVGLPVWWPATGERSHSALLTGVNDRLHLQKSLRVKNNFLRRPISLTRQGYVAIAR